MESLDVKVIDRLVELGKNSAGPQLAPGANVPYVMTAEGPKVMPELVFNDHEKAPKRIKALVEVLDVESFCIYHKGFANEDTAVFAQEEKREIQAVLDYHSPEAPGWCQHRLVLKLRHSEEWTTWFTSNNKQFTQQAFAEFLEQNAIDIVTPRPADMMEIARDLQATSEVEFGAGVRMQDGQVRFKYTEVNKASVGGGSLQVPESFVIGIPVFVRGAEVQIQSLFRYRIKEGKLVMWYTLVRPEVAVRAAFDAARQEVINKLDVQIVNGSPA